MNKTIIHLVAAVLCGATATAQKAERPMTWQTDTVFVHDPVMAFEGGAVATHMMTGFTTQNVRTTIITCTRGEIRFDGRALSVVRFDGHPIHAQPPELYRHDNPSRHDGGDFNLVAETLRLIREGTPEEIRAVTDQALQSHLICFAAERSRLAGGALVSC